MTLSGILAGARGVSSTIACTCIGVPGPLVFSRNGSRALNFPFLNHRFTGVSMTIGFSGTGSSTGSSSCSSKASQNRPGLSCWIQRAPDAFCQSASNSFKLSKSGSRSIYPSSARCHSGISSPSLTLSGRLRSSDSGVRSAAIGGGRRSVNAARRASRSPNHVSY